MNFYNDIDKDACEWARELIRAGLVPDGVVSDISIKDIKPHELTGFTQCHFFSGILGWPLALQLAGVSPDDNTYTGSCPCQPFSGTGKQLGFADPRHLWPAFRRIINRRRPAKVYGEQVASALGREWLSRVFADLETMGYAGSGADLCSAGVGAPNIRQRLYWGADRLEFSEGHGWQQRRAESDGRGVAGGCGAGGVAVTDSQRLAGKHALLRAEDGQRSTQEVTEAAGSGVAGRLGYADHARREGRLLRWNGGYERAAGETGVAGPATLHGFWSVAHIVYCRDDKWRRIEPGSFPLAHGIPSRVGPLLTELRKLGKRSIALARANRNLRLKGYGNAINPIVAAQFIMADRRGPC